MSWSMIEFGEYWASAHDTEQILFMSLAPEFLDSSDEFRELAWLQEWKAYWIDHKGTHANGCTDIDLQRFIDTEERNAQFRRFLNEYKLWLRKFGSEISVDEINRRMDVPGYMIHLKPCRIDELLAFAKKVEDTLDGNLQNVSVHRK